MRIGIIALLHETNTFTSEPTRLSAFEQHLLLSGAEIRSKLAGTDHEIGGFFERLDRGGCEVVPIFAARALPYGTITAETYETLLRRMLAELAAAAPLDGLLVAPHGATVSEVIRDVDGDWLTRVREVVGPDVPIISTADPHGNLSEAMVAAVNAIVAYRTNPHIDQRARGVEAADLLLRTIAGDVRPVMAAAFPPMVISIDRQCTQEEPCRSLFAQADEVRTRPGVLSCSVFFGFPYSDVAEMGSSVVVVADGDRGLADDLAAELGASLWERRSEFLPQLIDAETAVEQALGMDDPPVLLLDMGDNVGGGSAADGTVLAHALHQRAVRAFVCLCDPQAVAAARDVGEGGRMTAPLGGKTDDRHGRPLEADFEVVSLHDGRFEEPQPRHGGMRQFDQGPTALVRTDSALTVMLTTRRMVPFSLHQLTDLGVDPAAFQVIVAKGVNAPIAAYRPVCRHIIRVDTPGVTTADVRSLDYQHRRRPMFPFEPETRWSPS